jgi:ATP-dependent Clp protease ATP-binding subunit ClpA
MNNLALSPSAQKVVNLGRDLAAKMWHPNLGAEHVMLALLQSPFVQRVLTHCQVDSRALYGDLYRSTERENVKVGNLADLRMINYDPSMHDVLNRAASDVRAAQRREVDVGDLLIAIARQTSRHWLATLFSRYAIHVIHLHAAVQTLAPEFQEPTEPATLDAQALPEPAEAGTDLAPQDAQLQSLPKYAVCLNQLAKSGKLTPVIGRDNEVQRVIQTLVRHRKNNPILVGEPGVGKTAIAEGLAQRLVRGDVPDVLKPVRLFSLNIGAVVAGTKYRGDFEDRIKAILEEVRANPDIVLVIDEIHTLLGAGSASGGTLDAANLLKPALSSGAVRVIGATTYDEYREVFSKDRALSRRFQKIEVDEPSIDETRIILQGLRPTLEAHHRVRYTADALTAALELSLRHLTDRKRPDKVIDVLDEAGARATLAKQTEVTVPVIEAVVAQIARVPVGQVAASDRERLRSLQPQLQSVIYGQEDAVTTLVRAIKVARAGIRQGERPMASLLFAGPTGVGKTELATQFAQHMGLPLLRFDMSEFQESHSISRLLGAPPGYVGHDVGGGELTEAVNKQPYAVVLLDEFEKAHASIARLLLQVMDRGVLTDAHGRSTDFRHVVLILTTNVGASVIEHRGIGFAASEPHNRAADLKEAIRGAFTPEFRNRLDAVVHFKPLGPAEIRRVVDKQVRELAQSLAPQGVTLEVTAAACDWLADHGYDAALGARPMRRLIEEIMHAPLADALIEGMLMNGGQAIFERSGDQVVPTFQPLSVERLRLGPPTTPTEPAEA